MSNVAAAIITIGDELLIGQTIDTNSAWIARHLNMQGIDVLRRVAVGDSRSAIWSALDDELQNASLLILTGGLGPTADDITKPLLNEYFGGTMVVSDRVLEHLKMMFTRRNRPFLERNMKQAEVPDCCTVLFNRNGTAPGMWFEKDGKVIISLPGVPFEMASIMEDEVLPRLRERFFSDALLHRSITTAGEGESYIADKIQDIEERLPAHIKLAYLPGAGMVKLRLTGRGSDAVALAQQLEQWRGQIAERLGRIVISLEDIPLEVALGRWFTAHGKTLGLAESCTGGNIAHHITQVKGASAYFKGALICYQDQIKQQVLGVKKQTLDEGGPVCALTATEMALGAHRLLDADFAFSVTGWLSPLDEVTVPVGLVWMAVTDGTTTTTREFNFPYDRDRNKDMATAMGMLMIWKFINRID